MHESVLALYHVGFWDGTQVARLGRKHLYSSSHIKGPTVISKSSETNLGSKTDGYAECEFKKLLGFKKDNTTWPWSLMPLILALGKERQR